MKCGLKGVSWGSCVYEEGPGGWREQGFLSRAGPFSQNVDHWDSVLAGAQDLTSKPGLHSSSPLRDDGRGGRGAPGHRCIIFVFFTEAAAESHLRLLSTVAQAVKGQGTICWVDCGYVLGTRGMVAGGCGGNCP